MDKRAKGFMLDAVVNAELSSALHLINKGKKLSLNSCLSLKMTKVSSSQTPWWQMHCCELQQMEPSLC